MPASSITRLSTRPREGKTITEKRESCSGGTVTKERESCGGERAKAKAKETRIFQNLPAAAERPLHKSQSPPSSRALSIAPPSSRALSTAPPYRAQQSEEREAQSEGRPASQKGPLSCARPRDSFQFLPFFRHVRNESCPEPPNKTFLNPTTTTTTRSAKWSDW